jgi:hypothetical protein
MGVKVNEAKKRSASGDFDIERFAIATSTSTTRHLDQDTCSYGMAMAFGILMVFLSLRFLSGFG